MDCPHLKCTFSIQIDLLKACRNNQWLEYLPTPIQPTVIQPTHSPPTPIQSTPSQPTPKQPTPSQVHQAEVCPQVVFVILLHTDVSHFSLNCINASNIKKHFDRWR